MAYEIKYMEDNVLVEIENSGELLYEDLLRQTEETIILANKKTS
jgi:hypothetical protein